MGITIAERNHWKQRVEIRIDNSIKSVYCLADPSLLERVRKEARETALSFLGLDELMKDLESIDCDIAKLKKNRELTVKQLVAKVRDCEVEEVDLPYHYGDLPRSVDNAIDEATSPFEIDLLSKHELGKQVLDLRREKEELLDTVWLATSSSQIKELWSKVCERLNHQPTPLQVDALKISPIDSDTQ